MQITTERMVLDRENTVLIGNVVMQYPGEADTLRMFCVIKGASLEKKEDVCPGTVMVVTGTIRQDNGIFDLLSFNS